MLTASARLALPDWIHAEVDAAALYPTDEARMALAVRLSALNVERGTGGPFGAAIFDAQGRLLSVGVNRVVPESSSIAHAEMMAYLLAQAATGRARLNDGHPGITLAASGQPCCMCYGATFWAGIDTLLTRRQRRRRDGADRVRRRPAAGRLARRAAAARALTGA